MALFDSGNPIANVELSNTFNTWRIRTNQIITQAAGLSSNNVFSGTLNTFDAIQTNTIAGDVTGNVVGNLVGDVAGDLTGNVVGNVVGDLIGDVAGDLTGNVVGNLIGNVTGNVAGDLTGNVVGNLIGNVTGNVAGNLIGNVTGNITGNITGNANTATTLATARTIGGVSFDGSANINLPGVNTTGNQNTTGTATNVTGTVAVANGGTGATTAAAARTNLGATTIGSNLFTLTNPGAITFPRFNANNTLSSLNAADFRAAIGAVTSVSGTGTVSGLTLSGTITDSGNLTLGGTISLPLTQTTGALPVERSGTGQTTYTNGQLLIGNSTGNTLAKSTLTAGTGITITNGAGSISIAAINNGTVTSVGGTGTVNGITLTGTVTSTGNLTLGGTLSNVSLTTQVTGTLPVPNGGTGQTTYTNGQLLIGNSTGNTLAKSTLTAGKGMTVTNGAGSITVAASSDITTVVPTDVGGTVNGHVWYIYA